MKESVFMAEWILGADLLNKSALCKKTEIDPSNFNKFLAKGEVPKQHLEKIKAEIIKFGYVPPVELVVPEITPQKITPSKATKRFVKPEEPEKEEVPPPAAAHKYDFTGEKFLIIEKYTQYPLSQKPSNPVEAKIWLSKKKTADREIKDAWDNRSN